MRCCSGPLPVPTLPRHCRARAARPQGGAAMGRRQCCRPPGTVLPVLKAGAVIGRRRCSGRSAVLPALKAGAAIGGVPGLR